MKHGDKITMDISGEKYEGHIEERMLGQWPDKREALFVIVGNTPMPHFPIPVREFQEYYGTIQLIHL